MHTQQYMRYPCRQWSRCVTYCGAANMITCGPQQLQADEVDSCEAGLVLAVAYRPDGQLAVC